MNNGQQVTDAQSTRAQGVFPSSTPVGFDERAARGKAAIGVNVYDDTCVTDRIIDQLNTALQTTEGTARYLAARLEQLLGYQSPAFEAAMSPKPSAPREVHGVLGVILERVEILNELNGLVASLASDLRRL